MRGPSELWELKHSEAGSKTIYICIDNCNDTLFCINEGEIFFLHCIASVILREEQRSGGRYSDSLRTGLSRVRTTVGVGNFL